MSRFCRDREVVLTFWKLVAKSESCPWALRVYCVYQLALSAKVATEFPPIPGTYKPPTSRPSLVVSADAPTEVEVEAADMLTDTKNFLKQLGGADADSQT